MVQQFSRQANTEPISAEDRELISPFNEKVALL